MVFVTATVSASAQNASCKGCMSATELEEVIVTNFFCLMITALKKTLYELSRMHKHGRNAACSIQLRKALAKCHSIHTLSQQGRSSKEDRDEAADPPAQDCENLTPIDMRSALSKAHCPHSRYLHIHEVRGH